MKRLYSLLLSIILLSTASAACISASSESATAQLQEMYAQGELLMAQGDYAGAATQFETLGAYSDASQMAMYCKGIMAAEDLGMYDVAVLAFQGLGDFKDSKQLMSYYQGRNYQAVADALIESEERDDLVLAKDDYDEAVEIYGGLALFKDCLTRLSACQSGSVIAQEKIHAYDYAAADKLEQGGQYEKAVKAFKALGNYSDSVERARGAQEKIYARDYAAADKLERDRKYEEAIEAFKALGRYRDSAERVKDIQGKCYVAADKLEQDGKYEEAIEAFKVLGNYRDSISRADKLNMEILYQQGCECLTFKNRKPEEAAKIFRSLGDYKDSAQQLDEALKRIRLLELVEKVDEGTTIVAPQIQKGTGKFVMFVYVSSLQGKAVLPTSGTYSYMETELDIPCGLYVIFAFPSGNQYFKYPEDLENYIKGGYITDLILK